MRFPRKPGQRHARCACRRALAEDCLFEVPGAAVYLEGEAEYWYESGATRELVFKNNRFVNCSYIPAWGAAPIVACPKAAHSGGWFFHRRIALEGNSFFCFDERILQLRQTGEICMTDNRYRATRARTRPGRERVMTSRTVAVCGNSTPSGRRRRTKAQARGRRRRARPARKMKGRRSP